MACRTCRNHSGNSNWPPKLRAFDRNCVAAAARKTRARNSLRSIKAVTGWRSACQVKPANSTTLATRLSGAVTAPCAQDTRPCKQQREAGGDHRESDKIQAARAGDFVARQREPGETDRHQTNRNVDEKYPSPTQHAEDHTAETGTEHLPTMTGMAATPMTRAI